MGKEGDTYPDGGRTGGGSQNHSPHYHSPHYAETDPLMDHTQGSNQVRGANQSGAEQRTGVVGGWIGRKQHRSTAHTTHTQQLRTDSQFSCNTGKRFQVLK